MSATQATVTSAQVAVRYRRNVGSLSIDTRPIYRTRCVGRDIDRYVGRDIDRYVGRPVDRHISIDTSAESQSICRPTYRSSIGRYVDRQSTDMSVEMSTDISVEGFVNYT